jgi:hypothetical protein
MLVEVWRALKGEPDPALVEAVSQLKESNVKLATQVLRLRAQVNEHREGEIRAAQALEHYPDDPGKVCTALWELSFGEPSRCATLSRDEADEGHRVRSSAPQVRCDVFADTIVIRGAHRDSVPGM